jgi:hypothetical protein
MPPICKDHMQEYLFHNVVDWQIDRLMVQKLKKKKKVKRKDDFCVPCGVVLCLRGVHLESL